MIIRYTMSGHQPKSWKLLTWICLLTIFNTPEATTPLHWRSIGPAGPSQISSKYPYLLKRSGSGPAGPLPMDSVQDEDVTLFNESMILNSPISLSAKALADAILSNETFAVDLAAALTYMEMSGFPGPWTATKLDGNNLLCVGISENMAPSTESNWGVDATNVCERTCLGGYAYHSGEMEYAYHSGEIDSASACAQLCLENSQCLYWDYGNNYCRLRKNKGEGAEEAAGYISGARGCEFAPTGQSGSSKNHGFSSGHSPGVSPGDGPGVSSGDGPGSSDPGENLYYQVPLVPGPNVSISDGMSEEAGCSEEVFHNLESALDTCQYRESCQWIFNPGCEANVNWRLCEGTFPPQHGGDACTYVRDSTTYSSDYGRRQLHIDPASPFSKESVKISFTQRKL